MNKNIPCIWMLCLLSSLSNGQSTAFPNETGEWTFLCYEWDDILNYDSYELSGDSLYNGLQYQIINSEGLIRTDSDEVFFIPSGSLNELLLYDFGLVVGDTFFIDEYHQNDYDYIIVEQIDSITTFDGVLRKVFHFSDGNSWIEGIGTSKGSVTFPWYFVSLSGECNLLCFSTGEEYILRDTISFETDYYETIYYSCNGLITNTKEIFDESPIEVFPNPFSTELRVQTNSNEEISRLMLYDIHARLVGSVKQDEQLRIEKDLAPGIYILEIRTDSQTFIKRLIKN